MLWVVVLAYVVLSPLAGLLIGRAICVRDAERPAGAPSAGGTAPGGTAAQVVRPWWQRPTPRPLGS